MADKRKEYTVEIGGMEHTLLLDAEDAERYEGAVVKASDAPANKARPVANKA